MGQGPQLPGDWDASGTGEPPAQLLRRAISHVESLLHRLENPTDKPELPAGTASAAGPVGQTLDGQPHEQPVHPAQSPGTSLDLADPPATDDETTATARDDSDDGDDGDTAPEPGRPAGDGRDNVRELARPVPSRHEPVVESATAPQRAPEPDDDRYVPLAGVSSTAQAEALRITLHAHEEAHRLRAEANSLRAEAAADGERVLVEARMLSDRLHVESRERATELLSAAKNEATNLLDVARAEAERIRRLAVEEAETLRIASAAQAERERAEAALAVLEQAERDAEMIRADALEQGRAEGARLAEEEAAAAAEEGRRAVEQSRSRAMDLLDAANDSADDVRATMLRLIEGLGDSLAEFDTSVAAARDLRATVDTSAQADAEDLELDTDQDDDEPDEPRRPLGLLFGAPRG